MNERIYLDYAATTPMDSRVLAAMLPYFAETFGNPASVHRYGQRAEAAVDAARETVAGVLNCDPAEIIFTSGGTEFDNLAVRGAALAQREKAGARLIHASKLEHPAVGKTVEQLQKHYGFDLEWLENDPNGQVDIPSLAEMLCNESALVSVIYANNEIGTINDLRPIADLCHQRGIPFHSDAVQAAAYLPLDVQALGVDMLSLGGHKLYGPKGVGALYIRKGTELIPNQTGGGHEAGMRSGTHNVPLIVGLAEALRLASAEREQRVTHVRPLRDQIIGSVLASIPNAKLTGHPEFPPAEPCFVRLQRCGWQPAADVAGCSRLCLLFWLSLQNWQPRTKRSNGRDWSVPRLGAGFAARDTRHWQHICTGGCLFTSATIAG